MATTDRTYYVITWKHGYLGLTGLGEGGQLEKVVVFLSQGGFAEDVADFRRQVKERFLEAEFSYQGIELDRTEAIFDQYFTLEEPDQVIDLDE